MKAGGLGNAAEASEKKILGKLKKNLYVYRQIVLQYKNRIFSLFKGLETFFRSVHTSFLSQVPWLLSDL